MPPMTTERQYFDMIYLQQKVWAVGGDGGSESTNSMDIYDLNSGIWTKQSVPFSVSYHCLAEISPHQFILIGGYNNGVSKDVMKNSIPMSFAHIKRIVQISYKLSR